MRDEFGDGHGAGGAGGAGSAWSTPAPDREVTVLRALEQGLRHHRDGELRIAADWYYSVLDVHPDQADALHLLGLISYQSDDGATAIKLIDRAVAVDPGNAVFYISRGDVLQSLGRNQEAVESYHLGIVNDPTIPEAFNNCGNALNGLGKLSEAESHLQQALVLRPDYATAYNNLGNVLRAQGQVGRAIECILCALEHSPNDAIFHSNLGVALREAGRTVEAVASHERALLINPKLAEAHFNLGNARVDNGDLDGAAFCFRNAVSLRPDFVDARFNLGNVLRENGAHVDAIENYREALNRRPDFADAHNNLGNVLKELDRTDEALVHFREALSIDPALDNARHMINALSGVTSEFAPAGFIRDLYDRYAPGFEQHLLDELDYRVPQLLADAITRVAARVGGTAFTQALDLGCGTGLAAQALHQRPDACDGIDLSPNMLAIASEKGIYRSLIQGDVLAALQRPAELATNYDLVLAGDSFIYFGDVAAVLGGVHAILQAEGLFAFSIETSDSDTFALRPSGRYAHNEAHVRATAADKGYAIEHVEPMVIRKERGESVNGMIFVLRRLMHGSPECR